MSNFFSTFLFALSENHSLPKLFQNFRRNFITDGFDGSKYLWKKYSNQNNLNIWLKKPEKTITVLATPHTIFLAKSISVVLSQLNIRNELKIGLDFDNYDNSLHIVICPQSFKKLPNLYISYQLEQTVSDRWFSKGQIRKLKNSLLVMDYSLNNIKFLSEAIPFFQLYYLPVSKSKLPFRESDNYDYDVLFYGDTNNPRRQKYLKELKQNFNVKVINNCFGENLWNEIQKAKIVVNVHYYDNALIETTRLYECLSNNCIVVSETSQDINNYPDLLENIDFVEADNIKEMIDKIQKILNNEEEFQKRKDRITAYLNDSSNIFHFYFCRVLLSLNIIDFDTFYRNTHKTINPSSNFWCLGLPESITRQTEFIKEKTKINNEIWQFPGIRHAIPWIGCGLSYKYMIKYAKEYNWNKISICEDDVFFNANFENNLKSLKSYAFDKNIQWDIISGHVTDINENKVIIKHLTKLDNFNIFSLNQTTGTVFNIYNKTIYDHIINWNHYNTDLASNAIDRYIQNKPSLNVITTVPYLVGHKEFLDTTLWNRKAGEFTYDHMTETTIKKMMDSID